MHPAVHAEFERLLQHGPPPERVLEVGALPGPESLLDLPALREAPERLGINLSVEGDYGGFRVLRGDAHAMPQFEDGRFDLVLCNAMLEHDPRFWLSLQEMRRVLRPGGRLVLGVPGFCRARWEGVKGLLRRVPLLRRLSGHRHLNACFTATLTFEVHNEPGDYYRFSPQAVREVLFAGCRDVALRTVMTPPRVLGIGVREEVGVEAGRREPVAVGAAPVRDQ